MWDFVVIFKTLWNNTTWILSLEYNAQAAKEYMQLHFSFASHQIASSSACIVLTWQHTCIHCILEGMVRPMTHNKMSMLTRKILWSSKKIGMNNCPERQSIGSLDGCPKVSLLWKVPSEQIPSGINVCKSESLHKWILRYVNTLINESLQICKSKSLHNKIPPGFWYFL